MSKSSQSRSQSPKVLSPDIEPNIDSAIDSAIDLDIKPMAPIATHGWNYEATVQRVEAIVARIESGDLELAAVFDQFAEAVDYLQQCEAFLSQRQEQVDLLIETLTDEAEF